MKTWIFLACAALLAHPGPLRAGGSAERLTILYTSSLNGNLDGCTCKSQPRAGLVKRAAYLRSLAPSTSRLLVDAGDIFDPLGDDLIAGSILQTYGELKYDAIGVGDQEFSSGFSAFLKYAKSSPFLSNNLMVCPDPSLCFIVSPSARILSKGRYKVGMFALIDPGVFMLYPDEIRDKLEITPPNEAAETILQMLKEEKVDLTILLYHGSVEHAEEIARQVPGIDFIIVGHEQRLVDAEVVSGTLIVSPGEEGNRLGTLTVGFSEGKVRMLSNTFHVFRYIEDPDDPLVRQRIDSYRKTLEPRGS
jgi:2',3'-cyclic-nucleotide 2'-phosphodiesterase (5'-nucleotidase family)